MPAVSRRALLAGSAGLVLSACIPLTADAAGLDYRKGVSIPAYAGRGLLFAPEAVMRAQVDALVDLGVGWLRTDLVAQQVSYGAAGVYDWTPFDRLFGYATSRGLRILACLQGQCTVDGQAPSQPRTALARQRVAKLAAAAATHFGATLAALEVGNEVNTARFWSPRPSVSEYGPLLAAVYAAVKRVRPALPVLTAGTGGAGASAYDVPTLTWYRQLYAAGYRRSFDALALHPYSGFTTTPGQNEEAALPQVRALMNAYGDTAKPIWGTETGAPTGGSYAVSDADQATILANSWAWWNANAGARGPLFFYTLDDFAAPNASTDAEDYFGLRRADGTFKPAYTTVKGLR